MQRIRYAPLSTLRTADFLTPADDTSPRQLPGGDGASLHWLTHRVTGCHLIVIGWIERHRPGLAVAVIDDQWRLLSTRFVPCQLPADTGARLVRQHFPHAAHVCVVHEDNHGLRATVALEQAATRHYPPAVPIGPGDGGLVLTAAVTDWFDLRVTFTEGQGAAVDIAARPSHHEPSCSAASAVLVGERRYWFAVRQQLPEAEHWLRDDPAASCVGSAWMVAEDQEGVPSVWRLLEGGEGMLPVKAGDGIHAMAQAHAFDACHAVALMRLGNRTSLCLADPVTARVTQTVPVRAPKGRWCVKAWTAPPAAAGGSVWLATDNGKLSAAHRDSTLWCVDYGSATGGAARRAALPTRVTRLTEDRVVTASVALDFADDTCVLWQHGHGIKRAEPMRGMLYRQNPQGEWAARDVASLAETLPQTTAAVVEHFGRPIERAPMPRLPGHGFTFAGRRIVVHALTPGLGFPTGWAFGRIDGE